MDPETTVQEIERIDARESDRNSLLGDRVRRRELTASLRNWIARGGFEPRDWKRRIGHSNRKV